MANVVEEKGDGDGDLREPPRGRLGRLWARLTLHVLLLRLLVQAYLGSESPDRRRGPDLEPPHRGL